MFAGGEDCTVGIRRGLQLPESLTQEGDIVADVLNRRIDFMGDAGRQLTDRFELLRMCRAVFPDRGDR